MPSIYFHYTENSKSSWSLDIDNIHLWGFFVIFELCPSPNFLLKKVEQIVDFPFPGSNWHNVKHLIISYHGSLSCSSALLEGNFYPDLMSWVSKEKFFLLFLTLHTITITGTTPLWHLGHFFTHNSVLLVPSLSLHYRVEKTF